MRATAIVGTQLFGALVFGIALSTFVEQVLDEQWREQAPLIAIGAVIGLVFWTFWGVRETVENTTPTSRQTPRVLVQPHSISFDKVGNGDYVSDSPLWIIASVPPDMSGRVTLTLPSGYSVSRIDKGAGGASWEEVNQSTFEVHLRDSGLVDLGRVSLKSAVEPSSRRDVIRLQFISGDTDGRSSPEERVVVSVDF